MPTARAVIQVDHTPTHISDN